MVGRLLIWSLCAPGVLRHALKKNSWQHNLVRFCLQVLLLMQVPPVSEDDRLAKAALFTKFTGKAGCVFRTFLKPSGSSSPFVCCGQHGLCS